MLRLAAVLALVIALWIPPLALAQAGCTFTDGFKVLHDAIPEIVGDCLDNAHFDAQLVPDGGGTIQKTTGGMLRWREFGNETFFTNGSTTWKFRAVPNLAAGITADPVLISFPNPPPAGTITPALSGRCSAVAYGYSNVIVATYGGDGAGLYGSIYNRCAYFALTNGDKGVTCFNAAMQGMMSDMPTYAQNKEALAERLQQRMALCL